MEPVEVAPWERLDDKALLPPKRLNISVGDLPASGKAKEKVKRAVLEYLREVYGLLEEDLVFAEAEAVLAWPARDVGFDRSMVGAYGQGDRACTYAALRALKVMDKLNAARLGYGVVLTRYTGGPGK